MALFDKVKRAKLIPDPKFDLENSKRGSLMEAKGKIAKVKKIFQNKDNSENSENFEESRRNYDSDGQSEKD